MKDRGVVEKRKVQIEIQLVAQPLTGDGVLMPPEDDGGRDHAADLRRELRRRLGN